MFLWLAIAFVLGFVCGGGFILWALAAADADVDRANKEYYNYPGS